ncbi:amino acid ABC transporter substrate-binding protein [Pseudorhodoferax aquiterrae]|uniref:Amino acid ABC transporter substrate-binding protein n=1 Tax=Pseudorhodoferax aquiterrae TaxID=747304 RepID=A0ABQ3G575_9BURK|nr:TonB-dependent siderophore receptor [Pseudorhodoferax aquiterrae]GHC91098.1 amino acid ABC transporter substrate-binding protein [Pseudorhodoferax aquiterrae]
MQDHRAGKTRRFPLNRCAGAAALALAAVPPASWAQDAATLDSIQVTGSWLGTGLQNSVKNFAGARTVVDRADIADTGATSIGDVLRRIPGVQSSDNSGTAGSAISLNVGVRGLTGRYSPRSTILLDGIPLAVAPYGQPQLSFAPISLANIESVDVVRGGGAVRYGPQNVGGVINFTTRPVPSKRGFSGDATLRLNHYGEGGGSAQYSTYLGSQLDNGLGLALLYSGMTGRGWREGSDERVNDLALKWRYELTPSSELYGKFAYYDVRSDTPGGLTVAQYNANPFQNTRPSDYWSGERKSVDVGYVNTLSDDQEFEIRAYYNDSTRTSALINAARTQIGMQPRDYEVLGIEPRYTHRLRLASTTHDVTVGYRYLRERGNDRVYNLAVATGLAGATTRNNNATDAHALYIDDRIALGAWRITPGLRFEHITSERDTPATGQAFDITNNKGLPSLNVAYLLTPAVTLFANYNTSYGPVQNLQLNSQSATNPLKPEVAKTLEAGARWTQSASSAELTVFKMKFDNQIALLPGSSTDFRNIGATDHEGIESAFEYAFDKGTALTGMAVYANFTYTRAIQKSGATAGKDVPFYSRITDTLGARYELGAWRFNLATTHQSKQYSDTANTEAEAANAGIGRIPGFRLWNLHANWKVPAAKGTEIALGINNLFDKRYYTRNVDGNAGRMVGAPRMFFVQGRYAF